MKKKLLIACIFILSFTLIACNKNNKDDDNKDNDIDTYVGTYTLDGLPSSENDGSSIQLYPTGDGMNGFYACTWEVVDEKIYMKGEFQGYPWNAVYIINDDQSITYEQGVYALQGTLKKVK